MTDVCSASDGKQLNIGIGHRNFLLKYWNIGHRPFTRIGRSLLIIGFYNQLKTGKTSRGTLTRLSSWMMTTRWSWESAICWRGRPVSKTPTMDTFPRAASAHPQRFDSRLSHAAQHSESGLKQHHSDCRPHLPLAHCGKLKPTWTPSEPKFRFLFGSPPKARFRFRF